MNLRPVAAALVLVIPLAGRVPAAAGDLTPDAAYALAVRDPLATTPLPKPDDLAAARKVLEPAAAREPGSARWAYALGHLANDEAQQAKGDAQKEKRKDALERFQRAAELSPADADVQYWLGSASFDRIDDVGMLSQMSLASQGRKAFEKAIALDAGHVAARVGLAQFYLDAPGIAGGSVAKAKDQGNALLALPGKRGEFQGRMTLGAIAVHEQDWPEMSRQLTAAETAAGDGASPAAAMRTHIWSLLNKKKDPQAAQPVVARYLAAAPADDLTPIFLDAEIKRTLGNCADALPRYEQVLAKSAGARGSRWGAAVCRDTLGQKDAARKDYEEYARRFPDDDRAKEARAAIKRLGGS
jgi:tetratricopeptide (TPR) repeat protein